MPPSKEGRKRQPSRSLTSSRSLSSSPRKNDPNQPVETGSETSIETITSPSCQSQPNTPSSTPRSRQLNIRQALNASRVTNPTAYDDPFQDEIQTLQTIFPQTFEEYEKKHTLFSDQEEIFNYIKRQDKKTYPKTVEPLHREGFSDEDRYVAIEDTVKNLFIFKHRLQYKTPRPPNVQNNERYLYSEELSQALLCIFPGIDLIVKDPEPEDPIEEGVDKDSATTTCCNTYQAEISHSEFEPSEASRNTKSTLSIVKPPRKRVTKEPTTPAAVTTEDNNDTTVPTYVSTTPTSLKVKTVLHHRQQGLLLGTPPNVQIIQDNHQPVQVNSPSFDSRLDTGIHQPIQPNRTREQLTPESQAAKD